MSKLIEWHTLCRRFWVWCSRLGVQLGVALGLYHRVSGPFPHSRKVFWGLFWNLPEGFLILRSLLESSPPLQWPKDLKIMEISEINELRDLDSNQLLIWILANKTAMKNLDCRSASLPPRFFYPRMEGSHEQKDSRWEKLEAGQSLLLGKAKSWIKSDETLKKRKKRNRWGF